MSQGRPFLPEVAFVIRGVNSALPAVMAIPLPLPQPFLLASAPESWHALLFSFSAHILPVTRHYCLRLTSSLLTDSHLSIL